MCACVRDVAMIVFACVRLRVRLRVLASVTPLTCIASLQQSLTILDVSYNTISDLSQLAQLHHLQLLNLSYNLIESFDVRTLFCVAAFLCFGLTSASYLRRKPNLYFRVAHAWVSSICAVTL